MKRLILFVSLVLSSVCSFSQDIPFSHLQNLRTRPLDKVEEYFNKKEWSLGYSSKATSKGMGMITWKNRDENSTEVILYTSNYPEYNRISMVTYKKSTYLDIMELLPSLGYVLNSSTVIEHGMEKVYKDISTTCILRVKKYTDEIYWIILFNNVDYEEYRKRTVE